LVGGQLAVQLFYIISGFLISYVLSHTPKYRNPLTFYWSRILRLYPIYYTVALMTLAARLSRPSQSLVDFYGQIPAGADVLLIASNILLFGQDWVMFFGVENGALVLTSDFSKSEFVLARGLLVPQAWTLGVELSFYLIAPFVLRDTRRLLGLLGLSLAMRLLLVLQGIGLHDPWTYRFFPAELTLFLLGALSEQLLLPKWRRIADDKRLARWRAPTVGTVILLAACTAFPWVPGNSLAKGVGLIALFLLLLPLAFLYQNQHAIDRKIGDLSYPMYIGHWFVILCLGFAAARLAISPAVLAIVSVAASIAFAWLLNVLIASRIEGYRKNLGSQRPGAGPPAPDPDDAENAPRYS
jgi:peptidoglycan/LPS O-acetylase OafA/YrhL